MSQAILLVDTLKKGLRQRGITYARVARTLHLSESSVKRLFSQKDLSLERIEQICRLMKIELTDLLELMHAAEARIAELTEEQEKVLVNEPKLLLVGILAISFWTAADILETFRISRDGPGAPAGAPGPDADHRLAARQRHQGAFGAELRLAQGRPDPAVLRGADTTAILREDIFPPRASCASSHSAHLSRRSNELLQQRLRKLAEEFDSLVQEDKSLGHQMRRGTTMILAIRPWEPAQFTELRRDNGDTLAEAQRQWEKA